MTGLRTMTLYRPADRATVFLEGEMDLTTAPAVGAAVSVCLSRGASTIDVEMSRLTFCDASGLNALLGSLRQVNAAGGRLRLRRSPPAVRRVFDLTGTAFLLTPPGDPSPGPGGLPPGPPVPVRPAVSGGQ